MNKLKSHYSQIPQPRNSHIDGKRRRDDGEPVSKRARTNLSDRNKAAVHKEVRKIAF